jgi:hypothetical protein
VRVLVSYLPNTFADSFARDDRNLCSFCRKMMGYLEEMFEGTGEVG